MRIVHICFSTGAEANIKHALAKGQLEGEKVIVLRDDLSMGELVDKDIISARQNWWNTVYGDSNNRYLIPSMEKTYTNFWNDIKELDDVNFCLWFGRNAQEACGMLYFMNLIKNKNYIIEFVNVSNIDILEPEYFNVSEVPSRELNFCYNERKNLKSDSLDRLSCEWDELVNDGTILRVVSGRKIISVNEEHYDDIVLSKIDSISKEASRVAALVMPCINPPICDRFILWRIRELISKGKIKSYGNPYNMMELHVQKNI